jgi:hypothetical protein
VTLPPRFWLVVGAVVLVGVLVFTPSITGGWIYDDQVLIPGNQYIRSFADWPHWFLSDFWDVSAEIAREPGRIAYWRPAVTASYATDWAVGGGSPLAFHVTNLLWQAVVGALAFVTLRRWLGATGWPAVVATLLFLVHPTKAESVAWIAGRTDVICMAAVLLATQGVACRLRGKNGGVLLEAAGTILAYTSKEQSIVLPAFVVIEAWVAGGRRPLEWREALRLVRVALPQIILAILYLAIRAVLLPIKAIDLPDAPLPFVTHLLLVFETLGRFITLTLAPHDLSVQHGLVRFADGERIASPGYIVLGAVALVLLVAGAFMLRRRMPAVTLGIAFFLLTLVPTMNIVNTQMLTVVSERFLYLPSFGLALAAGWVLLQRPQRWLFIVAALAIATLSVQAARRASDFSDERAFWERELALHPESGEARRGRIRKAFNEKRYPAALREILDLNRKANLSYDVQVAVSVADLVARLTPDRDRATLQAIDTFCADMLARKQPEVVLRVPTLEYKLATNTRLYEHDLASQQLALLALRSTLRSRLGDDQGALDIAQQALNACPRCATPLTAATLALARAGRYDDARAVIARGRGDLGAGAVEALELMIGKSWTQYEHAQTAIGPEQLRARAAAFAELELWGRAYGVLEPYRDQLKQAPKAALGFAELAYRAGETEVARDVLASAVPGADIETTFAGWAQRMGWSDDPRPTP